MVAIHGIDGMTPEIVQMEVRRGGRFVQYEWCISVVILSFRRGTAIYFMPSGESRGRKGLRWTLLTLLAGWWGFPWGPIYTIAVLRTNLRGGRDLTDAVVAELSRPIPTAPEVEPMAPEAEPIAPDTEPIAPDTGPMVPESEAEPEAEAEA